MDHEIARFSHKSIIMNIVFRMMSELNKPLAWKQGAQIEDEIQKEEEDAEVKEEEEEVSKEDENGAQPILETDRYVCLQPF